MSSDGARSSWRTPTATAALIAGVAAVTISAAWAFQLAGYAPCELCLKERIPYYGGVPLAVVLVLLATRKRNGLLLAGFAALALIFAAGTVLASYHAGVEWDLWPGPASCTGSYKAPADIADFLNQLQTVNVVRCDTAALRILGLSLAGWDALMCAMLTALSIRGALQSEQQTRQTERESPC